ncbi:MAG: phytoene desaturase family protein [Thermomicrobiales bacterium]
MTKHVIVIGAGFGGLATAIRLLARGFRVTLIEQRDQVGGRAYVYRDKGFTFDGGPTVITAPWLLDELFALAGRRREDYFTLVPVDPFYRIFFHDGSSFDYTGDAHAIGGAYRRVQQRSRRCRGISRIPRAIAPHLRQGLHRTGDYAVPFARADAQGRARPGPFAELSNGLQPRLSLCERRPAATGPVLSPASGGRQSFQTTSIYALIHHLEREWSVWFAMGGTGAITAAMERLFLELGRASPFEAGREISTEGRRANGVRLADGSFVPADAVVCNAEVAAAYQRLIPAEYRRKYTDRKLAKMRYSMSLVVIYFGTDRRYRDPGVTDLAHHNIILGPRYRELLADIFDRKVLADDFSLYLHMPTLTDPSLAPPDGDAFYVLAPVPHLGGSVDWDAQRGTYRDAIMSALEQRFLPDLSRHIVTERMIDPIHFRDELSSYQGSAFSVEPILTQSAWFRPHNRSEELDRLYFVGAGTHPGAGVPGVLSSATIVDELLTNDLGHAGEP